MKYTNTEIMDTWKKNRPFFFYNHQLQHKLLQRKLRLRKFKRFIYTATYPLRILVFLILKLFLMALDWIYMKTRRRIVHSKFQFGKMHISQAKKTGIWG